MDFRQSSSGQNRPDSNQHNQAAPFAGGPLPGQPPRPRPLTHPNTSASSGLSNPMGWVGILNLVNLAGIALLLIALSVTLMAGKKTINQYAYVDTGKYQAVFLNNGQVYFGNVKALNSQYVDLQNVYYLTQANVKNADGSTSNGEYSLEKLGCRQIHYPTDRMLINRDQVTFWENLNKDGKIVKSIEEFRKQNPKGPDCSNVSQQTQSSQQPQQSTGGAAQSTTPATNPTNTSSPTTR
jgi:hypothetical protein